MKRTAALFAAFLFVAFTSAFLAQAGWLTNAAAARSPSAADPEYRWRFSQPHHWRACLLQQ
jgi:hypothetical protein